MKNKPGQIQLYELGDRVLRSWWTVVAGISLGLSVSLLILQLTPRVFEATALLHMKLEKLTGAYQIPSTVGSDFETQLETLKMTVLSKEGMERIAAGTFDLPDDAEGREALLQSVRSGISGRYSSPARELRISCRNEDPYLAADVANTVAELYVEEYRRLRSGLAKENTRVLEALMAAALKDLQAKNKEITDFRSQHAGELADQLPANQRRLDELTQALSANQQARETIEDRIRDIRDAEDLSESLESMSREMPLPGDKGSTPQLAELRGQLKELRSRYSDSHPDIQALKRRIEEVEKTGEADPDSGVSLQREQSSPGTDLNPWRGYIQAEQRSVDRLKTEEREIRAGIQRVQTLLDRTGLGQQELNDLSLGRDILERNYIDARQRVELARAGEIAEENQISGEFVVRSKASPPSWPISPKPLSVIGLCTVTALLLFVGPLVAKWFLFPVIGSEAGLRSVTETPILVSVPRLATSYTVRLVRRRRAKNLGLSFLSATILAGTVAIFWLG